MAFKVKDLMIDVAGIERPDILCALGTLKTCALMCTNIVPSRCFCSYWRTPVPTCVYNATTHYAVCDGGSVACDGSWDTTVIQTTIIINQTPVLTPVEIAPLKEQLKAALELVEKQEKAVNEQLQPKTLQEVNLLERKLTEALHEIKAQKAELEKKAE